MRLGNYAILNREEEKINYFKPQKKKAKAH